MKVPIIICVVLFLTLAEGERNWSKIKTRVHPAFKHFSNDGSRIVGGEEAIPHQFPYQVTLLLNSLLSVETKEVVYSNETSLNVALFITASGGTFFCGGSLISQRYVLTAAHCVDDATQVETVLGAHKIREDEPSQKRYISSKFTVHNGYNPFTSRNDIALIELPEEVPLNADIQLIPLPRYADVHKSFSGELATASGWGRDSDESNSISKVLRYVESNVITNIICSLYYGVIESTHICTSGSGGKSTCNGDSGGPLVIGAKQIGVVSFGVVYGCEKGWPAAFTRVTSYLDWIAANSDVAIN